MQIDCESMYRPKLSYGQNCDADGGGLLTLGGEGIVMILINAMAAPKHQFLLMMMIRFFVKYRNRPSDMNER